MLEAVIFDLDGTLIDSEQQGHRVAFNQGFEAFGLADRWEPDQYRRLLSISGGERRLFAWFSSPDSSLHDRPEAERRRIAAGLHRWKTDRFVELATAGEIPAQPGAVRVLDELDRAGVPLAIATTGSGRWAAPLVERLFGRERFATVVTGEDVQRLKPDPEAYLVTLARLGRQPSETVAIEDSGNGWKAARSARIPCVVVANAETAMDDVAGAELVIDGFGGDGDPAHAVVDRHQLWHNGRLGPEVLADFRAACADGRASRH